VLGGFDSVRSQDLVQQLQQEPAVELVRDNFGGVMIFDATASPCLSLYGGALRSIYKWRVSIGWWTYCHEYSSRRRGRRTMQGIKLRKGRRAHEEKGVSG
jgi:hypothetical protein